MSYRPKPKGEQIVVCVDSGANIHSANYVVTTAQALGCDSRADWDALSDEAKLELVQEFFYADGYPEWSWDDGSGT